MESQIVCMVFDFSVVCLELRDNIIYIFALCPEPEVAQSLPYNVPEEITTRYDCGKCHRLLYGRGVSTELRSCVGLGLLHWRLDWVGKRTSVDESGEDVYTLPMSQNCTLQYLHIHQIPKSKLKYP